MHEAPGTQVTPPFLAEAKSGTAGHRLCDCLLPLLFPVWLNLDPGCPCSQRPEAGEPQLPPLVTIDTSELRGSDVLSGGETLPSGVPYRVL